MKNYLVGSAAIFGLMGLFLTGLGETSARADDDYRFIPNDRRPLVFWNPNGSLHYRSSRRPGRTRQRSTSEPSNRQFQQAPSTDRSAERRNLGERSIENEALICPVTGDKIASVKDAVGQSTYKGKTYYFCCAGCKPRFDKDPAKFVKNAAAGKFETM